MAPSIRFVGLLMAALVLGMVFQTLFFEKAPQHATPVEGVSSAHLEKLITEVGVSLKSLRERSARTVVVAPPPDPSPVNVSVNLDGAEELASQLKGFSAALDKAIISASHQPNAGFVAAHGKSTTPAPKFRKREISIVSLKKCIDTNVAYANNTLKVYDCNAGRLCNCLFLR